MAAPTGEVFVAGAKDFNEVDAVHTASGAFGDAGLVAEHDAGAVVFARDAAGDDADDAGMPVLTEEHDAGRVGKILLDDPLRFFGYRALDILPFAIEGVERLRGFGAEFLVIAEHQFNRERSIGEATAGVDAWAEAIGDIHRQNFLHGFHAGDLHERAQAGPSGGLQNLQTMAREDAVLAGERHEIGHGAECDEIQIVAELYPECDGMVFRTELFEQAMGELENKADGAEIPPGDVRAIGTGVDVRVDEQALPRRALL